MIYMNYNSYRPVPFNSPTNILRNVRFHFASVFSNSILLSQNYAMNVCIQKQLIRRTVHFPAFSNSDLGILGTCTIFMQRPIICPFMCELQANETKPQYKLFHWFHRFRHKLCVFWRIPHHFGFCLYPRSHCVTLPFFSENAQLLTPTRWQTSNKGKQQIDRV